MEDTVFSDWTLDWEGLLGSDHALARVQGSLLRPSTPPQEDNTDLGFVIDEEKSEEWQKRFKDKLGTLEMLPARPVAAQIDTLACNRQVGVVIGWTAVSSGTGHCWDHVLMCSCCAD